MTKSLRRFVPLIAVLCLSGPTYAEKTDLALVGQQAAHYFFTVSKPWSQDQGYLERVVKSFCATKDVCIAHVWDKAEGAAPTRLPFTQKQVDTEVVTFQGNKKTGRSVVIWNCKKFPKESKDNCFMPSNSR